MAELVYATAPLAAERKSRRHPGRAHGGSSPPALILPIVCPAARLGNLNQEWSPGLAYTMTMGAARAQAIGKLTVAGR